AALGGLYGSTTAGIGAASAAAGGSEAAAAGAGLTGAAASMGWVPVVGWILAGMATANKLYANGWDPNNGSIDNVGKIVGNSSLIANKTLTSIGISPSIANLLSGASIMSALFGRKNPKVTSAGVEGMITVDGGFQGQDYADWTAKGGVFRSDANGTVHSAATQQQVDLINGTVQSTVATIKDLSNAIGGDDGLQGKLSQFQYSIRNDWQNQDNVTKSLTDLSNSLVSAVYPLQQYQQSGETLAQTATRLTTVFNATNGLADMLGKTMTDAFGAVGLASANVRLNLVAAAGGIDSFNSEVSAYFQAYYSSGEQLSEAQKQMQRSFESLGLEVPKSKDAFRALVSSLDLTTTSGQATFAALMAIAPAFDQMTQAAQQAADAQQSLWNNYFGAIYSSGQQSAMSMRQLQDQFTALGVAMPKTTAGFQALVENMDTSDPKVKALQNSLLALAPAFGQVMTAADQARQQALGDVQTAYTNQVQAIQSNIDSINQFIDSLTSLKQSLKLGDLSTLSPQDKYLAEKKLFNETSAKAAAGDKDAQSQLPQVAQDFLNASRAYNASSQAYVDDFNAVQSALDSNIATAQAQLSAAQQQLAATNQMVQGILDLNQTAQSLADALSAYFAAGGTRSAAGGGGGGVGVPAGSGMTRDQVLATADPITGLIPYSDANPYGPMGGITGAQWDAANAAGASAAFLAANPWIAELAAQHAMNGSHAGGLDSVPFDGYRAELHKGEAVVTSANNQKLSQLLNIDWSQYGRGSNAALVAEIQALRDEVAQLRGTVQTVGVAQLQQAEQQHAENRADMSRQTRHLQTVGDNTARMAR
ncbi:phage tail tape measure protein, partial [Paraburkholderia bengalensis]